MQSQDRFDIGAFGGASYYMGDINNKRIFYSPAPSYGGLVYYHFTTRYSLKTSFYKASLSGNDKDFKDPYKQLRNASFSANLLDISVQLEFNFSPYENMTKLKDNFTFFVAGGLGANIMLGGSSDPGGILVIPMGGGIKYNLVKRLTVGAEWSYRRMTGDKMDGVVNQSNKMYHSSVHNRDWYSFGGLFLSYKIFSKEGRCPVYED